MGTAFSAEVNNDPTTQESSNCHATYFPDHGKLFIPCIVVVDIKETYDVVMEQQVSTDSLQFVVREWAPDFTIPAESSCHATYVPEYGRLLLPCVDVVDSSGTSESHQVVMEQLDSTAVELPKLVVMEVDGVKVEEASSRSLRGLFGGTINLTVSGAGKVTSPKGTCGSNQSCSWKFDDLLVTLTATPNTDNKFTGWGGGACLQTGTGGCMVKLKGNQTVSVKATFATSPPTPQPTPQPSGVCTSGNANINSISTICYNGSCSYPGVKITCNNNSCQWCDVKNKCGSILYNGTTTVNGGSISCTNGQCKYNINYRVNNVIANGSIATFSCKK